ncbi:hypothetical protein [Colwellia psychrerythraea]|uniref:Uncharacterized protein n=1 Tax=Colwellia psychrerythraea TaxID=28229 RepID=A0A099KMT2_COLPS|nr:hypothetical protein [Colwellia psychrerythraea]KGJ91222.1 hypothetical protein GAB14E_3374 [Colwellia psychrerythraea]
MSTEHDKNKVTIDDEKFIDALYAELEREIENELKNTQQNELTTEPTDKLFTEQPSASLDQRILAAAHKAVDSSPKAIDFGGEKSSKIRKSRTWHVPLSLAASTVLVVSLVVNQGEESVLPNGDIMLEPIAIQAEQALSTKRVGIAERNVMAQGQSREFAKQSNHQAKKNANPLIQESVQVAKRVPAQAPVYVARKQEHEVAVAMVDLPAFKAPENSVLGDKRARTIAREETSVLQEKSSASKLAGLNTVPFLSLQQYQLYKEQSKQWLLRNESRQYYLIDVFDSEQKTTQYKLLKKYFNIKPLAINLADGFVSSLANGIDHKHSFEQIEALDEK